LSRVHAISVVSPSALFRITSTGHAALARSAIYPAPGWLPAPHPAARPPQGALGLQKSWRPSRGARCRRAAAPKGVPQIGKLITGVPFASPRTRHQASTRSTPALSERPARESPRTFVATNERSGPGQASSARQSQPLPLAVRYRHLGPFCCPVCIRPYAVLESPHKAVGTE
jgi:hypothetical protein